MVTCLVSHGFLDNSTHLDSGLLLDRHTGGSERWFYKRSYLVSDVPMRTFPDWISPRQPSDVLTIREIESYGSVKSDLVLLLACSAGANRILRGDQPASIAEILLRLGARSVISPLWDCGWELALNWSSTFLDSWLAGRPKALAARDAFRSMSELGDVLYLGPLHLRGDWR